MARPSTREGKPYSGRRTETRPNGVKYIYRREYVYDKTAKKTIVLGCKLLGKILPGTKNMVSTRPKKPSSKKETQNQVAVMATRQHVGMCDILNWAGDKSGIAEDIKSSMPSGEALKTLSVANYLCATEGTLPGMEHWQIVHPMPYTEHISEATCSNLFTEIGNNESWIQDYFNKRASRLSANPALALDSTTVSTYSVQLNEARYGYSRDDDGLPTVKLCTLYSVKDKQPIAFAKQPGNIPDVISLKNALCQLDAIREGTDLIVTDCGYVSEANIAWFMKNHKKFLSLVRKDARWVKEAVSEALPKLGLLTTIYPPDPTVTGVSIAKDVELPYTRKRSRGEVKAGEEEKVERRAYINVYRNEVERNCEANALYENIYATKAAWEAGSREFPAAREKILKKFFTISKVGRGGRQRLIENDEAYAEATRLMGVFVLVTNKPMTAFEALTIYRLREKCEEAFGIYKGHLDGKKPRVQDDDRLRGRHFVQFVSLGLNCFLLKEIGRVKESLMTNPEKATREETRLRRKLLTWLENRSLLQILQWFDCTEETTVKNEWGLHRWRTEQTKQDELFLSLLGLND